MLGATQVRPELRPYIPRRGAAVSDLLRRARMTGDGTRTRILMADSRPLGEGQRRDFFGRVQGGHRAPARDLELRAADPTGNRQKVTRPLRGPLNLRG